MPTLGSRLWLNQTKHKGGYLGPSQMCPSPQNPTAGECSFSCHPTENNQGVGSQKLRQEVPVPADHQLWLSVTRSRLARRFCGRTSTEIHCYGVEPSLCACSTPGHSSPRGRRVLAPCPAWCDLFGHPSHSGSHSKSSNNHPGQRKRHFHPSTKIPRATFLDALGLC